VGGGGGGEGGGGGSRTLVDTYICYNAHNKGGLIQNQEYVGL